MVAEPRPDLGEHPLSASVFRCVVKQRGDRLVLAAAILDHQRAHAEQMADVRDAAAFAQLGTVCRRRELERVIEALAEYRQTGRRAIVRVRHC